MGTLWALERHKPTHTLKEIFEIKIDDHDENGCNSNNGNKNDD